MEEFTFRKELFTPENLIDNVPKCAEALMALKDFTIYVGWDTDSKIWESEATSWLSKHYKAKKWLLKHCFIQVKEEKFDWSGIVVHRRRKPFTDIYDEKTGKYLITFYPNGTVYLQPGADSPRSPGSFDQNGRIKVTTCSEDTY
jgi:hypothetical protein